MDTVLATAAVPPPGRHELDLWWWTDEIGGIPHGTLSPDELARADELRLPDDAARFRTRRGVLRVVLAGYLGTSPRAVRFDVGRCPSCGGPHGPPHVANPFATVRFSVSSSPGLSCCAIATDPVGIDVERSPAPGVEDVVTFFHHRDQQVLAELDAALRTRAATRCWVRNEALLKARGTGIVDGLGAAPVLPEPGVSVLPGGPTVTDDGWTVMDLAALPRHAAAVATRATTPVLRRSVILQSAQRPSGKHSQSGAGVVQ